MISSATKGCGCGSSGACACSPAPNEGFSRPNFFAGQLLTDEDLRDAMEYVVQKNRLYNRHYLGEGVVCGLQVLPHPCRDNRRKVIVRPGHAINGCGDDILVDRDREVDVLALVRDLIARKRGDSDCSDPCADRSVERLDTADRRREVLDLKTQLAKPGLKDDEKLRLTTLLREKKAALDDWVVRNQGVQYGLYVRFEMQKTRFMSPYAVDEGSSLECLPSRICEGYKFELRCHDESSRRFSLQDAVQACSDHVKKYPEMQGKTLHGLSMLEMALRIVEQYAELRTKVDPDQWKTTVENAAKEARKHVLPAVDDDGQPVPVPADTEPTSDEQRAAIAAFHSFVTVAMRALQFSPPDKLEAPRAAIKTAARHVAERLKFLRTATIEGGTETSIPRSVIDVLIARAEIVTGLVPDGTQIGDADFDRRSHVVGELLRFEDVLPMYRRLDDVNQRLLGLIASAQLEVSSELRAEMATVGLSQFNSDAHLLDADVFREIMKQARIVSRAVAEVNRLCMCMALLPPRPTENDQAVLLATVVVENCEVRDICNLCRRMVVTGPSLRYWFSDFEALLGPLRKACSPSAVDIESAAEKEEETLRTESDAWKKAAGALDFAPNVVEKRFDDRVVWDYVHLNETNEVAELAQIAVIPKRPLFDLNSRLTDAQRQRLPEDGFSPQLLNVALAALGHRPETDIRDILAWGEEFGSPGEIRQTAERAEREAAEAKGIATGIEHKADQALTAATNAQTMATGAQTAATNAQNAADAAAGAATNAQTTATGAQTAATNAQNAADAAAGAATNAQTTATGAQTAATNANNVATSAAAEVAQLRNHYAAHTNHPPGTP